MGRLTYIRGATVRLSRCLCVLLLMFTRLQATTQEANNTNILCSNLVPGLDKMAQGIDIANFDLHSKDNVGLKHQVIPYTCGEGKKKTIDGTEYDLPDQVDSVTAIPGGIFESKVKLVKTYNESREVVAENLEVDGIFKAFGFSGSKSLNFLQNAVFNKSSYVEKATAFDSARRARLLPDYLLKLHSVPQAFIDERLPADIDPDDPTKLEEYREFIRYFGTHFFQTANFGGLLLVNFETKHGYYMKHTDETVKKQASAYFMKILRVRGIVETSTVEVDQSFESMTTSHIAYFGGSANLLEPGGYQKWQPTVSSRPWLFLGNLIPIYKLINNESKKAAMERVVIDYVLRAYLHELASLLSSRQWSWKNGLITLQQLQDKVNVYRNKTLLTAPEIISLAKEVQDQVTVSDWFSDKTRNCYDWYPYSNGQCSGPTPHLCVSPGLMTQANRDETDPGGCHAWGTQARHDAWFEGIQICFRWEQCTGDWRKDFCKSIRDLTTTYAHDDDLRGKECQVSWKVVIPANAPVWQQNFRLCFLWRPEQEGENCGGEQCVVGNWSRFYPEQMKLLQKCTTPTTPSGDALKMKNASFLAMMSLVCFLYLLQGYTV